MSTQATVTRGLQTIPSYPSISGYTQSVGGVNSAPISYGPTGFAANTNASLINAVITHATVQEVVLWSDKGITLNFGNATNGTPSIILQPGSVFEWNSSDGYFANPFSTNTNTIYVSCNAASRLSMFILQA
jgi:hypothetical protein